MPGLRRLGRRHHGAHSVPARASLSFTRLAAGQMMEGIAPVMAAAILEGTICFADTDCEGGVSGQWHAEASCAEVDGCSVLLAGLPCGQAARWRGAVGL